MAEKKKNNSISSDEEDESADSEKGTLSSGIIAL